MSDSTVETLGRLLTARQLAERLNVSTVRVYELVRQGHIPAIRVGERNLRFDPAAVRRVLTRDAESAP